MLKRLIEVALPIEEVSECSAHEKNIRHGQISTLHIWWARRPLAACRAAVFASLIPDPDDPECPESFRKLVGEVLGGGNFTPKNSDGSTVQDTPRNRCLQFIKRFSEWENASDPSYLNAANRLLSSANAITAPKVLDPFAGGGAIPLESARLGCESHAVELNPVAHIIETCTLVYPQRFGRAKSRRTPEYIKALIHHASSADGRSLFPSQARASLGLKLPSLKLSEKQYQANPLVADVRFWGRWVLERAREELQQFYPPDKDGSHPVGYLWCRTVKSPDPQTNAHIPLVRQLWLANRAKPKIALRMKTRKELGRCEFEVVSAERFDFDPGEGTMRRGQALCPFSQVVASSKYLQAEGRAGRMGVQLMAVITGKDNTTGKRYRAVNSADEAVVECAARALRDAQHRFGEDIIPTEPLKAWSGVFNAPLFGMKQWADLFNPRQLLSIVTFVRYVREAAKEIAKCHDEEYAKAIVTYLGVAVDEVCRFTTTLNAWKPDAQAINHMWGRQALPMIWDYCENCVIGDHGGTWAYRLEQFLKTVENLARVPNVSHAQRGSVLALPFEDTSFDAVVTDPPYYDAVPYSDLSDFFYVWLKRTVGPFYPDDFRTPLTPKTQEVVSHLGNNYPGQKKTARDYEERMRVALGEINRVLKQDGVAAVMFAHKTTSAWESVIGALMGSGLLVTASWPIHTEQKSRMRAQGSAALASSVTLVCRKRKVAAGSGIWDDVRQELKAIAQERLDFFWNQGIRGADFFISAIGPALSVFGQYERVTKLSGEEVKVGQFLDEVRSLVSNFALAKILKTMQTGTIDPESRFYVVWKWSYGDAKVPADESFKLSQALGLDTDRLWDKTGVLEKSGENVQATAVAKRIKIKNLGEPTADGASASLIDVLHRMCAFREKGDTQGMGVFLGRSGHANNHSLWLVAQAVSEILPDGEKEKQLMQGLLNQKEQLEQSTEQRQLF